MTTGLIIGKFMPPHAGHQYLIDFARERVAHLELVLFTKTAEPIPGGLRAAWLRELYPDVAVHHVQREGAVDFASPGAWSYWVQAIREVVPSGPDFVFSSEDYGDELARRLGARHVRVDDERRQVPVSATQIRARPLAYWDYLPVPVRPYFVRRVAILGAESTGKTTLAAALAEHFQTVWSAEYAREFLAANDNTITPEVMRLIARGQAALEERRAREANRLLVGDTSLLTTLVWHEHYYGFCPDEIRRLAETHLAHLYFVCGLDVPWVADGLRDRPEERGWFHRRFCQELTERGLPFVVLSGSHEARMARAIGEVERMFLIDTRLSSML